MSNSNFPVRLEVDPDNLDATSVWIHEDTNEAYTWQPTPCPICKKMLSLFELNYEERFIMCPDPDCPYPFGIEDYHIYKLDEKEELLRLQMKKNNMCVPVESRPRPASTPPSLIKNETENLIKLKKLSKSEEQIKKNAMKATELNQQLKDPPITGIDDDKLIMEIIDLEKRAGVQLLSVDELNKVT